MLTWQAGYGAFSVSQSNLNRVLAYVEQQEKHHKKRTYQDEFRELCRKHKIEIDERYVWIECKPLAGCTRIAFGRYASRISEN